MKKASSATNLIAFVTILGAVAAGFATGPAFAQTGSASDGFEFKFVYSATELQSAQGAEKLLARLESEVRDRCAPQGRITMDQQVLLRSCVNETMQKTVSKFASASVAQAYDVRAGG